jgi:hypothetical protein
MEHFGDELPVLTLSRIIEQVLQHQPETEPQRLLVAVKQQFADQFPGTPFPWNDSFVLEVWQQVVDGNFGGGD